MNAKSKITKSNILRVQYFRKYLLKMWPQIATNLNRVRVFRMDHTNLWLMGLGLLASSVGKEISDRDKTLDIYSQILMMKKPTTPKYKVVTRHYQKAS